MYTACPVFLYCVFLCFLKMEAMITKEDIIKGTIRSFKKKKKIEIIQTWIPNFFKYLRIRLITDSAAMVSSTFLFRLLPSKTWGVVLLWLFFQNFDSYSCLMYIIFLFFKCPGSRNWSNKSFRQSGRIPSPQEDVSLTFKLWGEQYHCYMY